jgi:TetR/AcrR family transcriptional regulator, transcriptional repressor for nem operon
VTNSTGARRGDKRQRLAAAAAEVLHRQGVERTTIADIAEAAEVPVGNVYYYFKTKDELVRAALAEHAGHLAELADGLAEVPDPRLRLRMMVESWVGQRDIAARYGCPTGTLATELDKRADADLAGEAAKVIRALLDWARAQFHELGLADPDDLALTFVGAYQGMSVLANALGDPEIMSRQGARLVRWLDSLTETGEG